MNRIAVLIIATTARICWRSVSHTCKRYGNFEVVVSTTARRQQQRLSKNILRSGFAHHPSIPADSIRDEVCLCQARLIVVTNNDVKADCRVISELVAVAETDEKIGFVTGKVYYADQPDILQTVGKREDPILWNGGHIGNGEKDVGQYEQAAERIFADDIYMLVRRSVYEQVGGYDSVFAFQAEEFDWQARAKKHGFKIFYAPRAKIWHKVSMTIGKDSAFKALI